MNRIQTGTSLGQLVAERPERARIFEWLGLDFCCAGKSTLSEACARHELDEQEVLRQLHAGDAAIQAHEPTDWTSASLTALVENITHTHHDRLRTELPRLEALLEKVVAAHGAKHPELHEIRDVFATLRAELETHILKEEAIVFPMCKRMERTGTVTPFRLGRLKNPIRAMEHEHDEAGQALAHIRDLTHRYTVPPDACGSYRILLKGLAELERDMHVHVHKENFILFPRAIALEATLSPGAQDSEVES